YDQGRHPDVLDRRAAVLGDRGFQRLAERILAHPGDAFPQDVERLGPRPAAEQLAHRLGRARLALGDEALHLFDRHGVEARRSADQRQALQALGPAQRDVARDAAAHRQPDQVRLLHAEVLDHAHHVAAEILELQLARVVVGLAVAARVPGSGAKALREGLELLRPVASIAADAMQEKHERAFARDRDREARRRADHGGLGIHSAFAPEIFTARPRLSRSFLMYATNSAGLLPTAS